MSYQYHAMSNFFNRDNVGLTGFAAFYRVSSLEERTHAQQLMDYQVRHAAASTRITMSLQTCLWLACSGDAIHALGNLHTAHFRVLHYSYLSMHVRCPTMGL